MNAALELTFVSFLLSFVPVFTTFTHPPTSRLNRSREFSFLNVPLYQREVGGNMEAEILREPWEDLEVPQT